MTHYINKQHIYKNKKTEKNEKNFFAFNTGMHGNVEC